MRFSSSAIVAEQQGMKERHRQYRSAILEAMDHGTAYPWALLARLQVRKFFADILESVLGAVWVDSGSMEECARVAERFGILRYLKRFIRENVHVLHPKEELGHLADKESVHYAIEARDAENGERRLSCKVLVGQRLVVELNNGVGREEIKTRAAEAAVKLLRNRKGTI
jgi:dsRNA-specific ribonuclease